MLKDRFTRQRADRVCEAWRHRRPETESDPVHRYELTVTLSTNEEILEFATLAHLADGRRSAALQQWSTSSRPRKGSPARRERTAAAAAEHGSALAAGRWPQFSKGAVTLTAVPQPWSTILTGSIHTRTAAVAHVADLGAGWHVVIADGDLPVIQIGKLVGFTRHRIYQLRQQ